MSKIAQHFYFLNMRWALYYISLPHTIEFPHINLLPLYKATLSNVVYIGPIWLSNTCYVTSFILRISQCFKYNIRKATLENESKISQKFCTDYMLKL